MSNLNTTKSNSEISEEQREGANTGNDIPAANIKASKVSDKRIEQKRGGTKDLEYGIHQDADEIEGKENSETYCENKNHAEELVNGLDFSENKKENACKEDAEIALKNKLADNCCNRQLSDKMGEPDEDHVLDDIGEISEGDERYARQHNLGQQNLGTTAQSLDNGKSSQETRREDQGEYDEVHKEDEEDWVDVLEGGDNMDSKDKVKKRKISEHDDKAMGEDKEAKAKKKEKKEKDKKDKKDKKQKEAKKKNKEKEKNKDKKKDGKEYDVDRLKQKLEKIDYKMSKLMAKKANYLRKLDHALQKKLVEAEAVVSTKDSLLKGVEELGAKISELSVART